MGYYFADFLHDERKHYGKRKRSVQIAVESIKRFAEHGRHKLDFIAVCGASGLSVGSIVAYELGIPCLIVRKIKEAENSHCGGEYLSPEKLHEAGGKYIILDDFIAGGNTVRYIQSKLPHCSCLGFYGYAADNRTNEERCKECTRLSNVPHCDELEDYAPGKWKAPR